MLGQTRLLEELARAVVDAFGGELSRVVADRLAEHDRRLQAEERYAWLALRTVAKLLDCGPDFARQQLAEQGIAPAKFGSEVRYPAAAVYGWLGPKEEAARKKLDRRFPRGVVLVGGTPAAAPRRNERSARGGRKQGLERSQTNGVVAEG